MNSSILLLPVIVPLAASILVLVIPKKYEFINKVLALLTVCADLAVSVLAWGKKLNFYIPWGGFQFDISLKLYSFNSFIYLAASSIALLTMVYSIVYMDRKNHSRLFYSCILLSLSFINGAVLSNNLIVMLFFWEGLLIPLFGMIMSGGRNSSNTAVKAFVLSGTADLCMMAGVGLTVYLSGGECAIDKIHLSMSSAGSLSFIFLIIGATAKAGSMPFHSWIPDAAEDAPLPFMAFIPGSLEKLLGIYFLTRICMDMFEFKSGSPMSIVLMTIGCITIICAVMMALVQHDYKKLLAYHSVSQVGYMVLGIGTGVPAGIVGGLFHMLNNAVYKCGLFLTAGSVERQTGTTDLEKLGGLGRKMPVTFACFIINAAAISGVPPFNGFFSKELIFDGALKSGLIFYIISVLGAFFTAVSFLKLAHAAYLGKGQERPVKIKEAPWPMLLPMIAISLCCILLGLYRQLPLKYLAEPVISANLVSGPLEFPISWALLIISLTVLMLACLDHIIGFRKTGSGLHSVDHISRAPVLCNIYRCAEMKFFDPYVIGIKAVNAFAKLSFTIDRGIDSIYSRYITGLVAKVSSFLKRVHTGDQSMYLGWSIIGMILMILIAVMLR